MKFEHFFVFLSEAGHFVLLGTVLNLMKYYDELQTKIHLEAMALTLGLTVVVGISYEISFDFGIINSEPETEYLIMFIGITYIVSVLLNFRRYI